MEEYGTIWNDETTTRIKSKIVSPEPVAKKKETVGARFLLCLQQVVGAN